MNTASYNVDASHISLYGHTHWY